MSRVWTAIAINTNGKCKPMLFTASFDYEKAAVEFNEQYPEERLVAMLPGQPVCQTFDLHDSPYVSSGPGGASSVDPFNLPPNCS